MRRAAERGTSTAISYAWLEGEDLSFGSAADAAAKLVEAYGRHATPQKFQNFLVATAGIDDNRGKNLAARQFDEFAWAQAGYHIRSFPGAGKAQFEVSHPDNPGKFVRIGRASRVGRLETESIRRRRGAATRRRRRRRPRTPRRSRRRRSRRTTAARDGRTVSHPTQAAT